MLIAPAGDVPDRGAVGSLEVRVPLLRDAAGTPVRQVAPFVDLGGVWLTKQIDSTEDVTIGTPLPGSEFIASAGAGLLWNPWEGWEVALYGGIPLRDIGQPDEDAQDYGVHFSVRADLAVPRSWADMLPRWTTPRPQHRTRLP